MLNKHPGIPANYYLPFARYMSQERNVAVLVFSFRFIGQSFPAGVDYNDLDAKRACLRQYSAVGFDSWIEDARAALLYARKRQAEAEIVWLGHSAGGQELVLCLYDC